MSAFFAADWTSTLERMNAALDRTLTELNEYQRNWAGITETPASITPPEMLLTWLERRLEQWDGRLTAASELAASVEKELADRETALNHWQEVFHGWKELIQQLETLSYGSGVAHVQSHRGDHPSSR
jgi:hypothetical protein